MFHWHFKVFVCVLDSEDASHDRVSKSFDPQRTFQISPLAITRDSSKTQSIMAMKTS